MKNNLRNLVNLMVLVCLFSLTGLAQEKQPVKILEKPRGILYGDYGQVCVSGSVVVKAELLASGQVGQVFLVKGFPYKVFNDSAVEAARKIKFIPAKLNGNSVTVSKILVYNFGWNLEKTDFTFGKSINPFADEKAEAVLKRAIAKMGGEKYLQVKTTIGKGLFTTYREGESGTPSSFVDYLVYPNKERTEFKSAGGKFIQTNVGETGWVFDSTTRTINDQTPEQLASFRKAMRTSLDYLLRGYWRSEKDVKLEYVGKREAGLGKRNEVIKITYEDGLAIEFEFAATDALPMKSVYKEKNPEGEETKQEDRYAQFVDVQGVLVPYIIDHYQNGKQTSRINYQSVEINAVVPDTIFAKPADIKKLK